MPGKAAVRFANRVGGSTHLDADRLVLQPSRRRHHDLRTARHCLAGLLCPRQRLQIPPLGQTQVNGNRSLAHIDRPPATRMIAETFRSGQHGIVVAVADAAQEHHSPAVSTQSCG